MESLILFRPHISLLFCFVLFWQRGQSYRCAASDVCLLQSVSSSYSGSVTCFSIIMLRIMYLRRDANKQLLLLNVVHFKVTPTPYHFEKCELLLANSYDVLGSSCVSIQKKRKLGGQAQRYELVGQLQMIQLVVFKVDRCQKHLCFPFKIFKSDFPDGSPNNVAASQQDICTFYNFLLNPQNSVTS